jgi:hypothetical protein
MKILKITTGMLLLSVFLFFSACNKDDSSISSDTTESEYDSPQYQVADLDEMASPEVTAPSETTELSIANSESETVATESTPPCMGKMERPDKEGKKSCGDKNGKKHPKKQNPRGLPFILKQLNLSASQKESIKGYLAQHCDCVYEHHQKVFEIHHDLMKRANKRRMELLAAYKDGKITKEQLRKQLDELRNKVKSELQNHEVKQMHIRIMRQCREELGRKIESVLNADQLTKWNRWKSAHK